MNLKAYEKRYDKGISACKGLSLPGLVRRTPWQSRSIALATLRGARKRHRGAGGNRHEVSVARQEMSARGGSSVKARPVRLHK